MDTLLEFCFLPVFSDPFPGFLLVFFSFQGSLHIGFLHFLLLFSNFFCIYDTLLFGNLHTAATAGCHFPWSHPNLTSGTLKQDITKTYDRYITSNNFILALMWLYIHFQNRYYCPRPRFLRYFCLYMFMVDLLIALTFQLDQCTTADF